MKIDNLHYSEKLHNVRHCPAKRWYKVRKRAHFKTQLALGAWIQQKCLKKSIKNVINEPFRAAWLLGRLRRCSISTKSLIIPFVNSHCGYWWIAKAENCFLLLRASDDERFQRCWNNSKYNLSTLTQALTIQHLPWLIGPSGRGRLGASGLLLISSSRFPIISTNGSSSGCVKALNTPDGVQQYTEHTSLALRLSLLHCTQAYQPHFGPSIKCFD